MAPKRPCGARAAKRFSLSTAREMIMKDDPSSSEESCSSYNPSSDELTGKYLQV